jgi:two-component system, LytTR family, sensor kinase
MKKTILYSLHGFVWFCDLIIIFLVSLAGNLWVNQSLLISIGMLLGIFVWSLVLFYMGYSVIVPKFFSKRKFLAGVAAIFVTSLVFPLIPHIDKVASAISGNGWRGYSLDGFVQVFFLSLLICVSGVLLRTFINWIIEQQKKKELEGEKLKSKLMVLINQNNPHFIFNVLNNIDSLITSKPAKASEILNKLSGLLRYIYSNSEKDKVSLLSEVEYIENYIELQTLRLDNEINIQLEKNNISANIYVVPMLFLPFIENVFKHGLVDSTNPAKISFLTSGKELIFECQNSYNAKKEENTDSGFGLSNIVKRLDLMYPSKYTLNIEKSKGIYSVSLTLTIDED